MAWQKYFLALLITGAIFGTAFYIASRLDAARLTNIRAIEDTIALDILSSETQFELLGNSDCDAITQAPLLSAELNSLASRLSVAEDNLGSDNPEVIELKKHYTLLEIKDYSLMQRIMQKCRTKPVYILYFYSNAGDCPDCTRAGEVLTYLREQYPTLRVYSFDYHLDISALHTLLTLRNVNPAKGGFPAFVINNRPPVYGFKPLAEMEKLIPELKTLATSTATSTGGR